MPTWVSRPQEPEPLRECSRLELQLWFSQAPGKGEQAGEKMSTWRVMQDRQTLLHTSVRDRSVDTAGENRYTKQDETGLPFSDSCIATNIQIRYFQSLEREGRQKQAGLGTKKRKRILFQFPDYLA